MKQNNARSVASSITPIAHISVAEYQINFFYTVVVLGFSQGLLIAYFLFETCLSCLLSMRISKTFWEQTLDFPDIIAAEVYTIVGRCVAS